MLIGDDADGGKLAVWFTQVALAEFLSDEATFPGLPYLVGGELISNSETTGELRWRMNDGEMAGAVLRIQVSLIEPPTPTPADHDITPPDGTES